jgi:hypothetical protein
MSVNEANQALGGHLNAPTNPEPCDYANLANGPPRIGFIIADGKVVRIDVDTGSSLKTVEGIGAGDTEAEVLSTYEGRVEVQPHKYIDGHYLIVRSKDGADPEFRMIFETDGKVVRSWRAGLLPAVGWVEGCS